MQYPVSLGDLEQNKQLFLNELSNQTHHGDGIFVLPEMWATGFDYANIELLAEHTPYICKDISKQLENDSIVISSLPEASDGRIYNTIFAIDSDGVKAAYRKNMLFSVMKEDQYFTAGNGITVFEYKGLQIGLLTCYEIRFPELFRMTANKGADLIIVPAIWPANKKDHWLTLLKARAIENQCFIAGCGTSVMKTKKKDMSCGYSVVYDPWGQTVAAAAEENTVLHCSIELEKIKEVRNTIPSFTEAKRLFDINRKTNL